MRYAGWVIFFSLLLRGGNSHGFQTYESEGGYPHVDESFREFTYYITPTYFDLLAGVEKPITPFLLVATEYSMKLLESEMAHVGLKLTFGGLVDLDSLADKTGGQEFDHRIYFDYTARYWGFSTGAPAGNASGIKSDPSSPNTTGGIIRMNGKFLNWHHPDVEIYSTLVHETMHVLGVGHSTAASSMMAYTEHWIPHVSSDDKLAMSTNYQVSTGGAPKVTATFNGSAAKGIEIVWIDTINGRSHTMVTDGSGVAKLYGLPPGSYYLAGRELTPTGPCFVSPTYGFLASFYVTDATSTNTPANAATIQIADGGVPELSLTLIAGKKKFDCHFVSTMLCRESKSCFLSRIQPGAFARVNILNDLVTTNHHTDTDLTSGYHAGIVVSSLGSASPLTFGATNLGQGIDHDPIGYDALNYSVADLTVSADAAYGTYAATCTSGGETALMSTVVEVQGLTSMTTNSVLWPEMSAYFTQSSDPRNYIDLAERPAPDKPKKQFGMACGSIGSSVAQTSHQNVHLLLAMLSLPAFMTFVSKRRRKP